jgi:hypothetical protein
MSVVSGQVIIGTEPTLIVSGDVHGKAANIRNRSEDTAVFLGGSGVTTANGYQLDFGEAVGVPLTGGDDVYGIVAADTEPVHFIASGVD